MFIRRTVVAAALIAFPIALAASAQATPCSYFGDKESDPGSQGICQGGIDPSQSIRDAGKNLQTNFSVDNAIKNLQKNVSGNFG